MNEWDELKAGYEKIIEEKLGKHVIQIDEIIHTIINKRIDLNLSQTKLAKMAGVKQSTIARLENFSGNPKLETIIKISNALGLKHVLIAK